MQGPTTKPLVILSQALCTTSEIFNMASWMLTFSRKNPIYYDVLKVKLSDFWKLSGSLMPILQYFID